MSIVNEQLLDDLNILSTQDLAMVSAAIDEDPSGFSLDRSGFAAFAIRFHALTSLSVIFQRTVITLPEWTLSKVPIV